MHQISDTLLNLHGPVIYAIVAALVFAEAALFFGFIFPGETAIVVGGVLAGQDRVSLSLLLVVVVVSATTGDSVGYEIGRRFGPRLLNTRAMRKHQAKVGKAHYLIRRRGAFAVFIGRFTALLRALMPALVGSARMPYPRFLAYNLLGGIVWGTTFTLGGYFVGEAFERAAKFAGRGMAVAVAVILTAALIVWSVRRHRRSSDEGVADATAVATPGSVAVTEEAAPVPES